MDRKPLGICESLVSPLIELDFLAVSSKEGLVTNSKAESQVSILEHTHRWAIKAT